MCLRLFKSKKNPNRSPTSIHLKLEDSGRAQLIDQHIQDRNNERSFWIKIVTVLFVCFLAYIYIPSFVSNSYSQISDNLLFYIITPLQHLYRSARLLIAPWIFQFKCYTSSYPNPSYTWQECAQARLNYPFQFLDTCHQTLKLTSQQCWDLLNDYPLHPMTKCLWGTYHNDQQKCYQLFEMLTLS